MYEIIIFGSLKFKLISLKRFKLNNCDVLKRFVEVIRGKVTGSCGRRKIESFKMTMQPVIALIFLVSSPPNANVITSATPNSSDLAPVILHLFRKMKMRLKCHRFKHRYRYSEQIAEGLRLAYVKRLRGRFPKVAGTLGPL